jgi:hypothetical protein
MSVKSLLRIEAAREKGPELSSTWEDSLWILLKEDDTWASRNKFRKNIITFRKVALL